MTAENAKNEKRKDRIAKTKEYALELCCVYTFLSVTGAIINIIAGTETGNLNVLVMFATCAIGTFVLFLHKLFDRFSPLFMIVAQYLIACALIGLMLLLIHLFVDAISLRGLFEFYRSFTIPYIFLAGFYYYRVFSETRKQAELIREIQQLKSKDAGSETVM
ncbi:MAG: hypothetical protein K6F53_07180 [Lachnospiraceae bacterium]|nr:hypothetical protein [Lachnospiraceae bacterium]